MNDDDIFKAAISIAKTEGLSFSKRELSVCQHVIDIFEKYDEYLPRLYDNELSQDKIIKLLNEYIPLYLFKTGDAFENIMHIYTNTKRPFTIKNLANDYILMRGDCFIDYTVNDTTVQIESYKKLQMLYKKTNHSAVKNILDIIPNMKVNRGWFVTELDSLVQYNQRIKDECAHFSKLIVGLSKHTQYKKSRPILGIEISNDGMVSGFSGKLAKWNGQYNSSKNQYRWKNNKSLILKKNNGGNWSAFCDEYGQKIISRKKNGWVNTNAIKDIIFEASLQLNQMQNDNIHMRPTTPPVKMAEIALNIIKKLNTSIKKPEISNLNDFMMHLTSTYTRNPSIFTHNYPYIFRNIAEAGKPGDIINACKKYICCLE